MVSPITEANDAIRHRDIEIQKLQDQIIKLEKRIEELEKTAVKCSCPPWYRIYVKEKVKFLRGDPETNVDTVYIRNAGWSCPIHGNIMT